MVNLDWERQALNIVGKTIASVNCGIHDNELREVQFTDGSSVVLRIGWKGWNTEWVEVEYERSPEEFEVYYDR